MTHTYKARISGEAINYRISILEMIDTAVIEREGDALDFVITCEDEDTEIVEYELRKAKRRDDFCDWTKIC